MREARRTLQAGGIDVRATLATQGTYPQDPTHRWSGRSFERAVLTPDGAGVLALDVDPTGRVDVRARGDGADWLVEQAPNWLGMHDDPGRFDPLGHPRVARWWRDHGRFRLAASGVIWQELVLVILGQRVTTESAVSSYAQMCRRWGRPAQGSAEGLFFPPAPDVVAEIDLASFHAIEVERRRAEALRLAARRAGRLEEAASMPADAALARLTALPGLGIWTATSVVTVSHGDPDTIVLRDHGLPTKVNYAFTGDPTHLPPDEGGDDVMLAHLRPWTGQRQRVIRLLFAAGVRVPRRTAKRANPDIRRL